MFLLNNVLNDTLTPNLYTLGEFKTRFWSSSDFPFSRHNQAEMLAQFLHLAWQIWEAEIFIFEFLIRKIQRVWLNYFQSGTSIESSKLVRYLTYQRGTCLTVHTKKWQKLPITKLLTHAKLITLYQPKFRLLR